MSDRLTVKVEGNSSGFKRTMDTVRTQAKAAAEEISHSWGHGLLSSVGGGIAAAFSFEAVKSSLESFLGRAKEIKDMSEQFEMSTDAVQKWGKAAEAAGLSASAAFNVISAIQSKRQEALHDPKAADLFSGIDVSREDVLNQEVSEFVKQVLVKGSSDDAHKQILEQIIGRRGLKVAAAAKNYDSATAPMNDDAIKMAEDAEKLKRKAGDEVDSFWSDVLGLFQFGYRLITYTKRDWQIDAMKRGIKLGKYADPDLLAQQDAEEKKKSESKSTSETISPEDDPLIGVTNKQMMERYSENAEAEIGLHEAERRNMTIAGRKKSIKADLDALKEEIKARSMSSDLGLIYGMTQQQQSKMLQSDVDKQLHADYLKLVALQTRAAGLTNELRDSKGFHIDADSMARVGLYSSSSTSLNPMLALSQKQVDLLRAIEMNTAKNHDPHRR